MQEPFSIFDYRIESAHDVDGIIEEMVPKVRRYVLVHIAAYLHNTVLVQSLVQKLSKQFPEAEIVLLHNDRDAGTEVTLYTCGDSCLAENDEGGLSNRALATLHAENAKLADEINVCQKQVVRRHFIDPLTNLPNLYQLRNDLEENENYSFIVVNIDNFKLINDFYGFIVGDYILEKTARSIAECAEGMQVYRMYGDEFAIRLDERLEFYALKSHLDTLHEKLQNLSFDYHGNNEEAIVRYAACY